MFLTSRASNQELHLKLEAALHGAANPGLFRTVEPNSPRTVYGLPLYRFDLCYIVYMVRNTIFHHDKVLPLGLLRAYGLPDAP